MGHVKSAKPFLDIGGSMKKKEAIDKFDPMLSNDTIYDFIEDLYEEGYLIVKPKAHMTKYNPEEEWIRIE